MVSVAHVMREFARGLWFFSFFISRLIPYPPWKLTTLRPWRFLVGHTSHTAPNANCSVFCRISFVSCAMPDEIYLGLLRPPRYKISLQ
ncbi:hypothetical protein LY76DRAFT_189167 [Colletotrichum caudatum]|nr:hypothetical protein LY76DRAFT_189167 [Colletotrichum caudatum]